MSFDLSLLRAANGLLEGPTGPLWATLGTWGSVVAFGAATLAWGAWTRRWRLLLLAVLAVAVVDPLCARVIKPSVGRERPCRAVPGLVAAVPCGAASSMPSNHAANTAAVAVALGSPTVAVFAVVTGVSRVVLGQHWPTDVLVGWAVGAAVGAGLRFGARRYLP